MTDKWGCPDWRDSDAYPKDPTAVNDWEWKWMFLRRLPKYRDDWVYLPRTQSTTLKDADRASPFWGRVANDFSLMKEALKHPTIDYEDVKHLPRVNSDAPNDWKKLHQMSAGAAPAARPTENLHELSRLPRFERERVSSIYALQVLVNPTQHMPEFNPFMNLDGACIEKLSLWQILQTPKAALPMMIRYLSDLYHWRASDDEEPDMVLTYRFSLAKPIGEQITRAEEDLKERQRKALGQKLSPKMYGASRETWSRHLRVIDAKDQGASHSEIFNQFVYEWAGGDQDKIDEYYRAPEPETETKDAFLAFVMGNPNADTTKRRAPTQPKALVSQWYKQAIGVMEKASRFL